MARVPTCPIRLKKQIFCNPIRWALTWCDQNENNWNKMKLKEKTTTSERINMNTMVEWRFPCFQSFFFAFGPSYFVRSVPFWKPRTAAAACFRKCCLAGTYCWCFAPCSKHTAACLHNVVYIVCTAACLCFTMLLLPARLLTSADLHQGCYI